MLQLDGKSLGGGSVWKYDNSNTNRSMRTRSFQLPPEDERIKDSVVFRSNSSKEWKNRRLVLTKNDLFEGLAGQDTIIEKIPLVSLKSHSPRPL